jgi:hypothetical protein
VYVFGFTYTGEESALVSQYAICYETLPDPLMKTSFVIRHFGNKACGFKTQAFGIYPKKTSRFVGQ